MSTAFPGSDNQQPQNAHAAPQQPAQHPTVPAQPEKKKGGCLKWGAAALGVLIVFGIAGSCGGGDDENAPAPTTAVDAPAKESEAAPAPTEEKNDDVPMEFKNALKKADGYTNRQHMSEARLFEQLTSEYGENFSPEAAQYAIENVVTDYNKNALEKAKSYQEHQAMSTDRIYEQLVSEYGENFTPEQAQYAMDNLPQ